MFLHVFLLVYCCLIIKGRHFNGGTINWAPRNPYDNDSLIDITVTQSYSWTYPVIKCANNVPGSSGFANVKLICVVDCSTDGGYNSTPITIATDCVSVNPALKMMNSERTSNLTLTKDAHFYLANVGNAWVSLNDPSTPNLEWSIVTYIDLRRRPDGFINSPPIAKIVSPQYVFVNKTTNINIPVSDANAGDDVRCRWAKYTNGYRRRRSYNEKLTTHHSVLQFQEKLSNNRDIFLSRKHRSNGGTSCENSGSCGSCENYCGKGCKCDCCGCQKTTCSSDSCEDSVGCPKISTTIVTTPKTATSKSTTTTIDTTTIETTATLKPTSSYPHRQAIDECGGICFPDSVPSTTTLSNCTISFTAPKVGIWYGIAIQVEDFISTSSNTPLSSVPVQLLIYVLPSPQCSKVPLILPINGCLEVQVGVPITFRLYAINYCNPSVAKLTGIVASESFSGVTVSNLTSVPNNSSLFYITYTWIPRGDQLGYQELCAIAYTSEMAQSDEYCEIFTVKNSSDTCVTTTTTSTSTTSTTSTTTSTTTETTTTTSTTTSTTTTSTTSSTSTTSTTTSTTTETTTTTSTSTSSTTSTSTSSTTSTSTSSTTSTSTSSTTSTTTSTTTTSTTSTTTTTTSTTTSVTTTTTSTTTSVTTTTITNNQLVIDQRIISVVVINDSMLLLLLLMIVCCCCCCLYCFFWSPAARRRRRRRRSRNDDSGPTTIIPRRIQYGTLREWFFDRIYRTKAFKNNHLVNSVLKSDNSISHTNSSYTDVDLMDSTSMCKQNVVRSTVSVQKVKRTAVKQNEVKEKEKRSQSSFRNASVMIAPLTKLSNIDKRKTMNSDASLNKTSQVDRTNNTQTWATSTKQVKRVQSIKSATEMLPMTELSSSQAFVSAGKAN